MFQMDADIIGDFFNFGNEFAQFGPFPFPPPMTDTDGVFDVPQQDTTPAPKQRPTKATKPKRKENLEGILELPNKNLEEVPATIFLQHSLKIVYLQDNCLQKLPPNFFDDLPYLAWCDLRFNCINVLPELKNIHQSLRVLMVQDNQLETLPYSLGGNAVRLKTLGLRGNPLHDPPADVIADGVDAIRKYLVESLLREQGHSREKVGKGPGKRHKPFSARLYQPQIKGRGDHRVDFPKALYNTVMRLRKIQAGKSQEKEKCVTKSPNAPFKYMDQKTVAKLKYTCDVWRDAPYDGRDQNEILNIALEDMRRHIMKKFNIQRDKILQRIKDQEILQKWRFETRCLQKAGRRPGTCCLVNPPYGVSSDVVVPDEAGENLQFVTLSLQEFQSELANCTEKLQQFAASPVSLSNSDAALGRLKEVEDIQRKLCSIRLRGAPHLSAASLT